MPLDLPPEFDGEAATPVANHLFNINDKTEKLNKEQAQLAHNNVAKLIFLCQCARPDIQTSMAFMSTWEKVPDSNNMKKRIRVMRYLHATK
eukprot:12664711-Ditylum_brightwellii.AAC.2